MKHIILMAAFLLCLCGCSSTTNQTHPNHIQQNTEQPAAFATFWSEFKTNIQQQNSRAILEQTQIPFIDAYGDIYDPENTLTSRSEQEFIRNYPKIFTQEVRDAIARNRLRSYDPNWSIEGDIIQKGDYILLTQSKTRSLDLVFRPIENTYYLWGIQYYL